MSEKKITIEELGRFAADKGFIYGPEPEIYNGIAGFYTYGPLGKKLKNNIENAIRKTFTKHEIWEVECPTVMPEIVWKASGHLESFSDRIILCSKCKANFRIDKLIEEQYNKKVPVKEELNFLKKQKAKCPNCQGEFIWETKKHELMMKTKIGLGTIAYNRPETATTTYLPVIRYIKFFRNKTPFGVFQIGKAYRNELSPRQNVLRGREFTQAEAQIFLLEEEKNNFELFERVKKKKLPLLKEGANKIEEISLEEALKKKYLKTKAYAWTLALAYETYLNMGIEKEQIRLRQHEQDERAFYALDAWDLEVNMKSLGWIEMCGIHDRADYDLKQHEQFSKKNLKCEGKYLHILEIAFGTDRPCLALLDNAHHDDKERGNIVLKLKASIAPIQLGIFPLVNKLEKEAYELYENTLEEFSTIFDKSGSIGRRYARADELGIPFCITIDFDTLKDKAVTIRDRNTTKQERVKIKDLPKRLKELLEN